VHESRRPPLTHQTNRPQVKPDMLRLDDNDFTTKQLLLTTFHHGVTLVLAAVLPTHPFFKVAMQGVRCRCATPPWTFISVLAVCGLPRLVHDALHEFRLPPHRRIG
jgi:hypothetical protein